MSRARAAGTATGCRSRSRWRRNSASPASGTSRPTGWPSSTRAAVSPCSGTSTRGWRCPGGWATGPTPSTPTRPWTPATSSRSGGRSRSCSRPGCWSATTGSARTAHAAAPRCPTPSSASPTSTRSSPTRPSRSGSGCARCPRGPRASSKGPTCWSGRLRRGRWSRTPRWRCTRTPPTWWLAGRGTATGSWSPMTCSPGCSVTAGTSPPGSAGKRWSGRVTSARSASSRFPTLTSWFQGHS